MDDTNQNYDTDSTETSSSLDNLLLTYGETIRLSAECTTDPTTIRNERKSCRSREDIFQCPQGFFLDNHNMQSTINKNGSENEVFLIFSNYIQPFPNVPEIEYPTKVILYVTARSPRCSGCRGWTKAVYDIHLLRFN
ncbi:hypothetical protein ABFV83_19100 [Lacrimispora sp. BS-2]|uniref:Uncharacterized protein n=1 Tax=Lacrimispora sp. BS-2 TaxID=3151850 RepID=A0AAU7PNE1_9FIRM